MNNIYISRFDVDVLLSEHLGRVVEDLVCDEYVKPEENWPHWFGLFEHHCVVIKVKLLFSVPFRKHSHIIPSKIQKFLILSWIVLVFNDWALRRFPHSFVLFICSLQVTLGLTFTHHEYCIVVHRQFQSADAGGERGVIGKYHCVSKNEGKSGIYCDSSSNVENSLEPANGAWVFEGPFWYLEQVLLNLHQNNYKKWPTIDIVFLLTSPSVASILKLLFLSSNKAK